MQTIDDRIDELFLQMVQWRRHLHKNPELSFREEKTAAFVAGLLEQWEVDVRRNVGGFGIVGKIKGGHSGPTVALRADMDALPIQDLKTCEYRSQVEGVMHACGHDGHTSVLLGLAKVFSEQRQNLAGNVVLLFQPAEEVAPGGALPMIQEGALDGVDVIYGVHLWSPFPLGEAYCVSGPMMAGVDDFTIEIVGKGGHGGLPHETVDSIVVGAHLIVNLQTIVSRNMNPVEPAVITIGSIRGGYGFNVIAEKTVIQGTVRTFHEDYRAYIRKRIEQVANETCAMFGANARVDYRHNYPPVVNDENEVRRFFAVAPAVFGPRSVKTCPLVMAGEDFSYYLQRIPGCFMFVGAGNKDKGISAPHHHPYFDIDEEAMRYSAKLLARMTLNYMENR